MPKVSKLQPGFSTGQISKSAWGHVDNPRYEQALAYCFNYIPLIQGPLYRRPGTKFVAYAKNPSQAPTLIPFQFSQTQNYILEFGDKYIRFYTNEGQVITSSNSFQVTGFYGLDRSLASGTFRFTGINPNYVPNFPPDFFTASSLLPSGSVLELPTWYAYQDVSKIKFTQKQDTMYLAHPSYPLAKLQRVGLNNWELKQVILQDGPYLPLNTYSTLADYGNVTLQYTYNIIGNSTELSVTTIPSALIYGVTPLGGQKTQLTIPSNPFSVGDKVFISGVSGLPTINNVSDLNTGITQSAASQAFYTVLSSTSGSIIISGFFSGSLIGSTGTVQPAFSQLVTGSSFQYWNDIQVGSSTSFFSSGTGLRSIAFVTGGFRYWGTIYSVTDSADFFVRLGPGQSLPISTGSSAIWQLGAYSQMNGFPSATCFHQDRLAIGGAPGLPNELDLSMTANYEIFSASGSNFQVANNNALQFNLNAQDVNLTRWMKSNSQGLLVGTQSAEWAVTPSSQGQAITPTNVNAVQVTSYGSADADAILAGNAALYIQRAQRRVRELLYFWQVGNFRSTNLSELADGMLLPATIKIVNQKEVHPLIWGLRSDGQLITMTYNRDDVTLQAQAGWASHQLGGRSDAANSPPTVAGMAVIPSGDTTYDELWLSVNRYMNGSTLATIEYVTKPYDDNITQDFAYHFDCGATYNSSIVVTGISTAPSCVVTAPNHGLLASSTVKFYSAVGVAATMVDGDGNITTSSMINSQTFMIASTSTNAFKITDFAGNDINTASASVYVGSALVNKLVTSISNLGWLAGEQVSVLADGGIHVNTSVTQAGVLNLAYPAAIVSVGYQYNSDGQLLRSKDGSAQGTSIGSNRRVNRVAFMLHNVGEFSFGPSFQKLIPAEFGQADAMIAGQAPPLFDGIYREGMESGDSQFTDTVCFRQNSGLPGMVQAITRFLEENDV